MKNIREFEQAVDSLPMDKIIELANSTPNKEAFELAMIKEFKAAKNDLL